MQRILILGERRSGLQRLLDLRATRPEWDGTAVSDPKDAERALANEQFDAVITEVESPNDDRLTFLDYLCAERPEPARLVMTNDRRSNEKLQTLKSSLGVLPNDTPIESVANLVERSIDVSALIRNNELKTLVQRIESLPPAPTVFRKLNQALVDDRSDAATVASIIGEDPALAGEVLRVVNSAAFGLRREITSIAEAVSLLGFVMVRNLATSVSVYRAAQRTNRRSALQIERIQQHSLETARIASSMASNRILADECYLAGLLHDVGKLVFITLEPGFLELVESEAERCQRPATTIEREYGFGVTHAEVGAYLLHTWGLPYPVIEAAAYHHHPETVSQTGFDTLAAVHVANRMAHDPDDPCDEYLATVGVYREAEAESLIA